MIKLIIKLFGVFFLISGISFFIRPEMVFDWIENNSENTSFYIFAIVFRLILGVLFIIAARASKYPGIIKFFGYLTILVAIILIAIGQEGFQNLINSIIPNVKPFAFVGGLTGMAFGGFLLYSFLGNEE